MKLRSSYRLFFFITLLALGISTEVDAKKNKKKQTKKINTITNNTSLKGISHLKLERTACFGRCPVFNLDLDNSGKVTYTGIRFTPKTGIYQAQISSLEAQNWFNRFANLGVDTMQDHYEVRISDLPGIFYTYTLDGKEKKINNAHFGPSSLKVFALSLDSLVTALDANMKKIGELKQ